MSKIDHKVINKTLTDFGLSEKEANIYTILLSLESGTAQEIAKKAGVNRSSTYVVLDSLKKHGLVSVSSDKKVQRYVATSPDILVHTIDTQILKQKNIREKLSAVVPELKGLYRHTPHKPKVRVFEGGEGLIAAFEDSLESTEKIMRICSKVENLYGIIPPEYFPSYVKRRIQRGIVLRGIHPDTPFSRKILELDPAGNDTPVIVPKDKFLFPADFAIYDDTIGYMSPEHGGIAILIESKEIAKVMKTVFDMAWEEAKRLSKESGKGAKKRASGDTK